MFLADVKVETVNFGLFLYLSIAVGMFDLGEVELWCFIFRWLFLMFFIFGFFEGMGFLFEDELGLVDIFKAGLLLAMGFIEMFWFGGGGW